MSAWVGAVGSQAPLLGQVEHAGQDCECAVCLSSAVFQTRVQSSDIGPDHIIDSALTKGGLYESLHDMTIVCRSSRFAFLGNVADQEAITEFRHRDCAFE